MLQVSVAPFMRSRHVHHCTSSLVYHTPCSTHSKSFSLIDEKVQSPWSSRHHWVSLVHHRDKHTPTTSAPFFDLLCIPIFSYFATLSFLVITQSFFHMTRVYPCCCFDHIICHYYNQRWCWYGCDQHYADSLCCGWVWESLSRPWTHDTVGPCTSV